MNAWTTVSDLATGAGTLVLAVATFASVRSANRSARTAEVARQAGMRPILMNTRLQDPVQKVSFADGKWLVIPGGGAAIDATDEAIYLALSVRNAGTGMGILHAWQVGALVDRTRQARPALEDFTSQTRDMWVASADTGFWQGALRDPSTAIFREVATAVRAQHPLRLDLLYGDYEGGQRVISRFTLTHSPFGHGEHGRSLAQPAGQRAGGGDGTPGLAGDGTLTGDPGPGGGQAGMAAQPEADRWLAAVVRHWNVDREDPRPR